MDKRWHQAPTRQSFQDKEATYLSIRMWNWMIVAPAKIVPLGCALTNLLLAFLLIGVQMMFSVSHTINRPGRMQPGLAITSAHKLLLDRIQTLAAHVYPFQQAGLISPVIDSQGMIWCSEIDANMLARLDPHTGRVTDWTVKSARKVLTTIAIDARDTVWFVEQADNMLGHFDPRAAQFTWYPLLPFHGRSSSPQGLFFDRAGMLWFTEIGGQQLGRLDPGTGKIETWSLPKTTPERYPYSLTASSDGALWIGMVGGALVRFDPVTQHFSWFPLLNTQADVTSLVADQKGHLWFNELPSQVFGELDIASGRVTEFQLPLRDQDPSTIIGISNLAVAADGTIWLANPGSHLLVHYFPESGTLHAYQPSLHSSEPFELLTRSDGGLWFTASNRLGSYIGGIDAV